MPLAVLKAELEVTLRERGGEAALRAAMRSAIEETDRIVKLAEDLLLLARAQDGTLPLDPVAIGVGELVSELGERFTPIVAQSGRELVIDCAPHAADLWVRADPDRIRQAISNLVDNSLRYGDGAVTLSARQAQGRVQLHVTDHGGGFGEAFAAQAFDRFSRADLARGRGGVGLGLAIVRTIAMAHGGDVGACDLPQGGADVWIAIPLANDAAACHAQLVGR
jgi:signal transduction histidine kinase